MTNWAISDKTVVITGGSSGIGLATARELSKLGARVLITSRSEQSAVHTAQAITAVTGNPVYGFGLDLADFSSVRNCAQSIGQKAPMLDVLVNNAGTIAGKYSETTEGFERTFAANYLGPFLFTQLLLPHLQAVGSARILNLSSELYRNAKSGLDFSNLQLQRGYSPSKAYANSKLAVMLFTRELRDRVEALGISAFAIHPGVIRTKFGTGRESSLSMRVTMTLLGPLLKSPEHGASTTIKLATDPLESLSDSWYWSETKPKDADPIALDERQRRHLWDVSERMLAEH